MNITPRPRKKEKQQFYGAMSCKVTLLLDDVTLALWRVDHVSWYWRRRARRNNDWQLSRCQRNLASVSKRVSYRVSSLTVSGTWGCSYFRSWPTLTTSSWPTRKSPRHRVSIRLHPPDSIIYNQLIYPMYVLYVCKIFCPEAGPSLDIHYQGSAISVY